MGLQVDYSATEQEVLAVFGPCGLIRRVSIMRDKLTGKPKG
jgi:RNA recognition motif-containing protein